MSPAIIFNIQLVLGYVPWLLGLAAYGDFATGVLAMLALMAFRRGPLFWLLVAAFNVVGIVDLVVDYYHGATLGLPAVAGQLGSAYAILMIYVPVLMITHVVAFRLMLRARPVDARRLQVA